MMRHFFLNQRKKWQKKVLHAPKLLHPALHLLTDASKDSASARRQNKQSLPLHPQWRAEAPDEKLFFPHKIRHFLHCFDQFFALRFLAALHHAHEEKQEECDGANNASKLSIAERECKEE